MKITNKDAGPRGFWRNGQLVTLDAGQSVDLDLSADDRKAAQSTGFFAFEAEKKAEPKPGKKAG